MKSFSVNKFTTNLSNISLNYNVNSFHQRTQIKQMVPVIQKLPLPRLLLGEGPHWCTLTESLYLVDIVKKSIYRYHPKTDKYFSLQLDVPSIGFVTPVDGVKDQFIVGAGTSLYTLEWDGLSSKPKSLQVLQALEGEPKTNRINDGKCDPFGRVWFGTMKITDIMNGREGSFYSYTKNKGLVKHLSNIGISNGMAWDLKKNRMYYIDSINRLIDSFDYSPEGIIENRREAFGSNELNYIPDGMTIDSEGKLWNACFAGSRVIRVDPETSALLGQIDIPTKNVTSVAWGGSNLSELYVTTAGFDTDENSFADDENAGCTFRVTGLTVSGLPMAYFKL